MGKRLIWPQIIKLKPLFFFIALKIAFIYLSLLSSPSVTYTSLSGMGSLDRGIMRGIATTSFKFMNNNSITSFSLPSFYQNFSDEKGIIEEQLLEDFNEHLKSFRESSWILN